MSGSQSSGKDETRSTSLLIGKCCGWGQLLGSLRHHIGMYPGLASLLETMKV